MAINIEKFFEVKSDQDVNSFLVVINESGRIKISKSLRDRLKVENISIYISKDYRELLLVTEGGTLKVKADGTVLARNQVEKFSRRRVCFPMKYRMEWQEEEQVWLGKLLPPEKISESCTKEKLREII